jgi:hypothetical protein
MKILVIYLIFILAISCDYTADNDIFTLPRENYTGNQLRIDGYYYFEFPNRPYRSPYFLYRNGVLFDPSGYSLSEEKRWELRFLDKKEMKAMGMSETVWGQFVIQDSIIKFEMYYPGDGPLWSYIKEGVIINDTTFHITKSYRSNGSEVRERDEMYHFRKFSPKPDSTNVFVK